MKDHIKGPEVTASTAFTVPPPNMFGIKQGCNAVVHACMVQVHVYTRMSISYYIACFIFRCIKQVLCLWNQYSCHVQALWALRAM